jgi:hypothetical protein
MKCRTRTPFLNLWNHRALQPARQKRGLSLHSNSSLPTDPKLSSITISYIMPVSFPFPLQFFRETVLTILHQTMSWVDSWHAWAIQRAARSILTWLSQVGLLGSVRSSRLQ